MKKLTVGLLLFIVVLSFLSLETKVASSRTKKPTYDAIDLVVSSTDPPSVKRLANFYKKGVMREKLGAHENALIAYSSCNSKAIELLSYGNLSKDSVRRILPYAIASAYRKAILTHRTIEGSVMKLYKQLEMYKDANTTIDEVLTIISNLSTERGINVPPPQYYTLYYARAYNRFGWAYALLNGSAWKRYIIYTPADTITMVDKSINDIKLGLEAFDIDADSRLSELLAANNVSRVLNDRLKERSPEHLTLALCFNNYNTGSIKYIVEMQLLKKMRRAVDFYKQRNTVKILQRGKKIFTYEDFMRPGTKELITTMNQFLEIMK
ncbi:hypothetical protein ACFLZ2_00280 [Candidatus Margulisiibacteriota bacterium]